MTDKTKFDFSDTSQPSTAKEWTLKRNLEDAEMLIQDQKHTQADLQDRIKQLEEKLRLVETEHKGTRRDALNEKETNNRLKEQIKDYVHKLNLYKIETEELVKQIDMADTKTREKEDELKLLEAEYDRKLKMQEERILLRRSNQDHRDTYELKR